MPHNPFTVETAIQHIEEMINGREPDDLTHSGWAYKTIVDAYRAEHNQTNKEPRITINGHKLDAGQTMTMRTALESFSSHLISNGLGDDEHGKAMVEGYLRRINELRTLIFDGKQTAPILVIAEHYVQWPAFGSAGHLASVELRSGEEVIQHTDGTGAETYTEAETITHATLKAYEDFARFLGIVPNREIIHD